MLDNLLSPMATRATSGSQWHPPTPPGKRQQSTLSARSLSARYWIAGSSRPDQFERGQLPAPVTLVFHKWPIFSPLGLGVALNLLLYLFQTQPSHSQKAVRPLPIMARYDMMIKWYDRKMAVHYQPTSRASIHVIISREPGTVAVCSTWSHGLSKVPL